MKQPKLWRLHSNRWEPPMLHSAKTQPWDMVSFWEALLQDTSGISKHIIKHLSANHLWLQYFWQFLIQGAEISLSDKSSSMETRTGGQWSLSTRSFELWLQHVEHVQTVIYIYTYIYILEAIYYILLSL